MGGVGGRRGSSRPGVGGGGQIESREGEGHKSPKACYLDKLVYEMHLHLPYVFLDNSVKDEHSNVPQGKRIGQ